MIGAPGSRRQASWLLWLLPVVLYWALWATTLQTIAPSGDAASTWASRYPTRTVLCVDEPTDQPPRLTLAATPTSEDRAAVDATLDSTEVQVGGPMLGVVFRDHAYRASLQVFGTEWPWMINAYSGGFSDWLEHAGFLVTGSVRGGFFATALLGCLALLLAMGAAGSVAGSERAGVARLVAGLYLASEPSFHIWKRVGTGREVWLQIAAVGSLWAFAEAWRRRSPGLFVVGAALVGIGLHDKLSFLGPALALMAGSALFAGRAAWRSPRLAIPVVLAGGLAAGLMLAPTALYWAAVPDMPTMGRQDGLATNAQGVLARLTGRPMPTRVLSDPSAPTAEDLRRRREGARPGQRPDARPPGHDPKGKASLASLLLQPELFWLEHWSRDSQSAEDALRPSPGPSGRVQVSLMAAWLLALLGVVRARGSSGRALRWAATVAALALLFIRGLSGDPHHVAMALPLLAVVLGAGLVWCERGAAASKAVAVFLSVVLAVASGSVVASLDGELEARTGRLFDTRSFELMAERLEQSGVVAPAVLDYEMMSLLEAFSADAVRPFFYGRAQRGWGRCLDRTEPLWLAEILRAHTGGHLLVVRERLTPGSKLARNELAGPPRLKAASELARVTVTPTEVFEDSARRWFATLYEVRVR